MHTLLSLILTAAAAVVIARPPGPVVTTDYQDESPGLVVPTRKYLKDFLLPRYLAAKYFELNDIRRSQTESPRRKMLLPAAVWAQQEFERLTRMKHRSKPKNQRIDASLIKRMLVSRGWRNSVQHHDVYQPFPARNAVSREFYETTEITKHLPVTEDQKKVFALTPLDEGYFEPTETANSPANLMMEGLHEGGGQPEVYKGESEPTIDPAMVPEPQRHIRQNPNLSRTKTLVADNLDKLRVGLSNKEYRLPVSLLPSNLRWLKISRPIEVNKSGHDELGASHIRVLNTGTPDTTESFYGVAVISAIGAVVVIALLGFAFAWYTLAKRAKAAADVDYPAYGVTGPTNDTSGDRKLAHSAHMYHYQHQKQQIIAMERNGMEHSGSFSEPESDDENEEGDYTVYECPGFATTGDIEVKNPMFNEEPTSATPGKCEVVKPQPKD